MGNLSFTYYTALTEIVDKLYDYVYGVASATTRNIYSPLYARSIAMDVDNRVFLQTANKYFNKNFELLPSNIGIKDFNIHKIQEECVSMSISDLCLYFKNFAKFLRYLEKCYNYTSNVFEYDIKPDIIITTINCSDRKITITIENSEILDLTTVTNLIDSFMLSSKDTDKDEDVSDKVYFITVNIERSFGNKISNTFSFLSNGEPIINDDSDARLVVTLKNELSKFIVDELIRILLHIIYQASSHAKNEVYIDGTILKDLEATINEGLYAYKC